MSSIDRYSEAEIEESFGVPFANLATMNYLGSHRVVAYRDDETNEMMVRVEVPGMCDAPSIEDYKKNQQLSALQVHMIPDGKEFTMVLKDLIYVNEREYYAVYGEGEIAVPTRPLDAKEDEGPITSLT